VTGTVNRITDETLEPTAELVKRTALAISRQLGFSGPSVATGKDDAA
jgi:hypothetical protein